MKILSGDLKSRNFYTVKGLRPTQSLVRRAVFDILGEDIEGAHFVDIFAGTGSMGLEALSRGAAKVTFVEKEPKHAAILEENLALLDFAGQFGRESEVLRMDAFAAIKQFSAENRAFNIVFIDPPYRRGLGKKALKRLGGYDILQPNSRVIIQEDKSEKLPETEGQLVRVRTEKYGATWLHIYQ